MTFTPASVASDLASRISCLSAAPIQLSFATVCLHSSHISFSAVNGVLVSTQNFIAVDVSRCLQYFIHIKGRITVEAELDVVILSEYALDDDVLEVPISDGLEFCSIVGRLKIKLIGIFARPSRCGWPRPTSCGIS